MAKKTISRCLLTTSIALTISAPTVALAEPASAEQLQQLIERAENAAVRAEIAAARLEKSVALIESIAVKDDIQAAINAFFNELPVAQTDGFGYKVGRIAPLLRSGDKYTTRVESFGVVVSKRRRRSEVLSFGALNITATPQANGNIQFVAKTDGMIRGLRYRRGELRDSKDLIKHDGFVIKAQWNKALALYTSLDIETSNARIAERRSRPEPFLLGKLKLGKSITSDAKGAWRNKFYLTTQGVRSGEGEVQSIAEVNYSGTTTGSSLEKLVAAEKAITTRLSSGLRYVEESDVIAMVLPLLEQFDTHSQSLEVKGLVMKPRHPLQKVASLKLTIDADGLQRKGTYSMDVSGVELGELPIPKALIPTKYNTAGVIANLPKGLLNKTIKYFMAQGNHSSAASPQLLALLELPKVKNSEPLRDNPTLREHILEHPQILENEDLQKMLNITKQDIANLSKPSAGAKPGFIEELLSANITYQSSSELKNGVAKLTEASTGVVTKDAVHQLVGGSLYQLEGLDAMQELLKEQKKSREIDEISKVLAVFAAFSDRKTTGGKTVDNYALAVDKEGKVTLNGKDISELMKNF